MQPDQLQFICCATQFIADLSAVIAQIVRVSAGSMQFEWLIA